MVIMLHRKKLTVGEVIELVLNAEKKPEKKQILKENDTLALRTFLRLQFDSAVDHDLVGQILPENAITNWKNEVAPANLSTVYTAYKYFLKAAPGSNIKKEEHFIKLVKRLNNRDANLLIKVRDRNLELGLTKKELQSIFPGSFS